MNQSTYISEQIGGTQCLRILNRLRAARGLEVSMPELARIGSGNDGGFCMVHSRIADLRKLGHDIPPARTHRVDGKVHSFYRLIEMQTSPKEAA